MYLITTNTTCICLTKKCSSHPHALHVEQLVGVGSLLSDYLLSSLTAFLTRNDQQQTGMAVDFVSNFKRRGKSVNGMFDIEISAQKPSISPHKQLRIFNPTWICARNWRICADFRFDLRLLPRAFPVYLPSSLSLSFFSVCVSLSPRSSASTKRNGPLSKHLCRLELSLSAVDRLPRSNLFHLFRLFNPGVANAAFWLCRNLWQFWTALPRRIPNPDLILTCLLFRFLPVFVFLYLEMCSKITVHRILWRNLLNLVNWINYRSWCRNIDFNIAFLDVFLLPFTSYGSNTVRIWAFWIVHWWSIRKLFSETNSRDTITNNCQL